MVKYVTLVALKTAGPSSTFSVIGENKRAGRADRDALVGVVK